ncbi:hypothetical protein [Verminephrobacter eiseniae]|uniref:hypothetical protein n=1 Tax=Verminephrobacter eiseniae TaxID=364317 RepID=UPI0002D49F91|nr:hypothetical protein [Verminephrobacter eiseniae]
MSRHRSSVGPRWPSKRIAALHRLPIQLGMGKRCALRCAPMAARSLRHLTGDATLGVVWHFAAPSVASRCGQVKPDAVWTCLRYDGCAAALALPCRPLP